MNNAVGCLTISRMSDCLPCRKEVPYPIVSAESVPSLIANLTYALYGTLKKSLVAGKIVWNIPCDPNNTAQIANIPRLPEEGLLCYFIRVIQGSSYNGIWSGTGAPTGNPATATALPGDFYIDTAASYLYGPLSTVWPAGVSLIGPTGQGFRWRGAWVSGQNYLPYDVTTNAGSCYQCILAITGSATVPGSDATHFSILAQVGANGTNGTNGTNGANGNWSTAQTINTQTGTSYTLVIGDAGNIITLNNAASIALTIPLNASVAFTAGQRIDITQLGAGRVTITPVSGSVVISSSNGLITRVQYSTASLVYLGSNTWLAVGDLAAS